MLGCLRQGLAREAGAWPPAARPLPAAAAAVLQGLWGALLGWGGSVGSEWGELPKHLQSPELAAGQRRLAGTLGGGLGRM